MKFLKVILTAVMVLTLLGCSKSRPILEPSNTISGYTIQEVEKAILKADFNERGWQLTKGKGNVINGTLQVNVYTVNVQIPYSATGYSINYVSSSSNMPLKNGRIHGSYNRWVHNLDKDIRLSLATVSSDK